MELAGSRSWRFAESLGYLSHVALFVRDAAGLQVPDDPFVPPALAGDVPDRRGVLDDEQRGAAAAQWPGWWRAVVSAEIRLNAGPGDTDPQQWLRQLAEQDSGAGEGPDFAALANRPELRIAARALFEEAALWVDAGPRRRPTDAHAAGRFPWSLVRDVAEDVAFDRQVGLDAVQGSVELLAVVGVWWAPAAPGAVLCSVEAAGDPTVTHAVLRAAFESNLRQGR